MVVIQNEFPDCYYQLILHQNIFVEKVKNKIENLILLTI